MQLTTTREGENSLRTTLPFIFLFFYIFAHYSCLFLLDDKPILQSVVSNILLLVAIFISILLLIKARINPKNNKNKAFILLLLLSSICYFLGTLYWTYYEYITVTNIPPILDVYDILMLAAYLFIFFAFIIYFNTHKIVAASTYIFDILLFIVITTTLSWVFIIRPLLLPTVGALDQSSLLRLISSLAYPIADLTILFSCLIILLCTSYSKSLLFIISGFLINIIANSANFYFSLNTSISFNHLLDPLWALSNLLIGISGLYHFEQQSDKFNKTKTNKYIQLFIPYAVMVIFLFVFYINLHNTKDPILIGVFIAIILLMIRLVMTIKSNEALNAEIRSKHSQLKEANDQLRFLAYHDELTKLPNRHFLLSKLQDLMDDYKAQNEVESYLLFIDLDGFKTVNDIYGHNAGDLLLKQIASRLKKQLSDNDFACRFAGDEFIVLLENKDKEHVEKLAGKIVNVIAQPCIVDVNSVCISASIGISRLERDDSMLSAINRADKAMYRVKKSGKNDFQFV